MLSNIDGKTTSISWKQFISTKRNRHRLYEAHYLTAMSNITFHSRFGGKHYVGVVSGQRRWQKQQKIGIIRTSINSNIYITFIYGVYFLSYLHLK